MKPEQPINEFADQLKQYLKTTTEIAKLEVLKRTVQMSAHLIWQQTQLLRRMYHDSL